MDLWQDSVGLQTCSPEARLSTATDLEPRQGSNSVVLAKRSTIHRRSLNILPLKTDQSRTQPHQQPKFVNEEAKERHKLNLKKELFFFKVEEITIFSV